MYPKISVIKEYVIKIKNSFKYNNALKTTAAYTSNRTILFDFITADTIDASIKLEKEKELIENSEVIDLELIKEFKDVTASLHSLRSLGRQNLGAAFIRQNKWVRKLRLDERLRKLSDQCALW